MKKKKKLIRISNKERQILSDHCQRTRLFLVKAINKVESFVHFTLLSHAFLLYLRDPQSQKEFGIFVLIYRRAIDVCVIFNGSMLSSIGCNMFVHSTLCSVSSYRYILHIICLFKCFKECSCVCVCVKSCS